MEARGKRLVRDHAIIEQPLEGLTGDAEDLGSLVRCEHLGCRVRTTRVEQRRAGTWVVVPIREPGLVLEAVPRTMRCGERGWQ